MTFAVGDKCLKVRVSQDPTATPAGGPYTVAEVEVWSPEDPHGHKDGLKEGCHPMRVVEGKYGHELLINANHSFDIVHDWECSCDFRHLPPSEPVKQSSKTKRPVTA